MDSDEFQKKLMGMFYEHELKRIQLAWCLASKAERDLRLRAVIQLSVELDKIKQVDIFATRLGESVIEDIIQGSWDMAKSSVKDWTFHDESPSVREKYAPLWEAFRVTIEAMCAEHERLGNQSRSRPN